MQYILVTGGLGFIGSHTCVHLLENNYNIIVIDNLNNSKPEVKEKIQNITGKKIIFFKIDLLDKDNLWKIFNDFSIIGVIHFAGYKAVNESIQQPLLYYNNNIMSTINLLDIMVQFNVYNLIFSSSSTVYGSANKAPFNENSIIGQGITNPYGKTKYMIEQILEDCQKADPNFKITSLRYFNPVGAHSSGIIGESPNDIPNNLMPFILKVCIHNNIVSIDDSYNSLNIYGNDYDTPDGSAIRDYIHVEDLAEAHLLALKNIQRGYNVYNVGTGNGTSVIQMVNNFKRVNNINLPYSLKDRREGDLDIVYSDCNKVIDDWNWKPSRSLDDICKDAWNFAVKNHEDI